MKEQFLNLTGLTELVGYLKTSIANHKEILPYASNKLFPSVGDINTIYINTATNTIYRWDSSSKTYITLAKAVKSVAISEATENGKITLTVDGNKTTVPIHGLGSAAYTNSSAYSPAGHTHTKAQVGLGNVDNTADANKSVKHATLLIVQLLQEQLQMYPLEKVLLMQLDMFGFLTLPQRQSEHTAISLNIILLLII